MVVKFALAPVRQESRFRSPAILERGHMIMFGRLHFGHIRIPDCRDRAEVGEINGTKPRSRRTALYAFAEIVEMTRNSSTLPNF